MANTITDLTVDLYNALDVVSRELVGFIPAVTSDMTMERAALNQTVRSPVAPESEATDITPDVTPPDDGDQTIGNVDMTITQSRRVPVRWNGEQRKALDNNGAEYNVIIRDQFVQGMRTLVNEVEADLAGLHVSASRAYGVAGTTPFSTAGDFTDASFLAKILKDNGAPKSGNQLVLDTTSGANLIGKQSRMDVAGQDTMMRQGVLLDTAGFAIRESAAVETFGSDSITDNVTVTSAASEGDTTINLTTDGTGAVNASAGDIITFAGDSEKYVVAADVTIGASSTGDITIAAPGLMQDVEASAAVSGIDESTRALGFSKNAIALATRAPALPEQGDSAEDRMIIQDPVSGLAFEVSMYMQYRQVQYEIALAWGVAMVKPEHCAILLG
jgi:hypothetical protein